MKNTFRHPDFINLKHKINSCEKWESLQNLSETVVRFAKSNKHLPDADDIMNVYIQKEKELRPDYFEEEIDTLYHKRNCGA